MKEYPTQKNVKEVRAFLGLASFYRKLVPDFAEMAMNADALYRLYIYTRHKGDDLFARNLRCRRLRYDELKIIYL